jgi:hypothetical protein
LSLFPSWPKTVLRTIWNILFKLIVVTDTCNPSTQETETEGSWVPGQPRLHSKSLSQKKEKTEKEK